MSNIVNKVKDAISGHHTDSTATQNSAPEGTHGPHSSRVANAADPRIDSDRDNRANTTGAGLGRTAGHGETGTYGGAYGAGSTNTTMGAGGLGSSGPGPANNTAGPHRNDMMNKADPRVDSDMDGSRNMGATQQHGGIGSSGLSGAGYGGSHAHATGAGYGAGNNANTGFGSSNTEYGTGASSGLGGNTSTYGAGSGATGMTGTHGAHSGAREGEYGPHSSRAANAADPRIDSDRDGRGNVSGMAPGPAPNTAGPHKSDMMNKMDPRVDSNMDGSNTMGGDRTYQ